MARMRAAVHRRYGPPSVVAIEEVDRPQPGADEVLLRIRATTVNRTDTAFRTATPFVARAITGLRRPKRPILGTEYAGEVVAVGSEATRFAVGERVFGYSEPEFGGHAEYIAVPAQGAVATMPDGMSFEQMAPGTEGAHYAHASLDKAGVAAGSSVFVYGATGAIGSAAVQLAKSRGAMVTAVCGTDHVEVVAELGADRVVDYQRTDVAADSERYDLVLDAVGKLSYRRSRPLLIDGGVYISTELGRFIQNTWLPVLTKVIGPHRVVFAFPSHNRELIETLRDLIAAGDFTPLIDRTYPLDEIVDAHTYVDTGMKVGNVVITTS